MSRLPKDWENQPATSKTAATLMNITMGIIIVVILGVALVGAWS